MENIKLNNGVEIPMLGLGTYKIGRNDDDVYNAVEVLWILDTVTLIQLHFI